MDKVYRGYYFIISVLVSTTLCFPLYIATKRFLLALIIAMSSGVVMGLIIELFSGDSVRPMNKDDVRQLLTTAKKTILLAGMIVLFFGILFILSEQFYFIECGSEYHDSFIRRLFK